MTTCANDPQNFDSDLPYEVLTGRVRPWNYAPYEKSLTLTSQRPCVAAMDAKIRFLHVFGQPKVTTIMATPVFLPRTTTFDHLGLDPTLARAI